MDSRFASRFVAALLGTALALGIAVTARASDDPGTVIYKNDKGFSVGKDGASFEFKAIAGDSYNIEFQQSVMGKSCAFKVGGTEFATTKSGKMWLKIRVPFEADSADMKVSFSIDGVDGSPCKPYKIKSVKIVKS
jgi:hypothetical protein